VIKKSTHIVIGSGQYLKKDKVRQFGVRASSLAMEQNEARRFYWSRVDPTLEHRAHEESLDNGTTIDVQVQFSRAGNAHVFIGV